MAMTWGELRDYANEQGRTRPQLERVARAIGLSPDVRGDLLLHNINRRIELRVRTEGEDAISGFNLPTPRNPNNGNQGRQGQRQRQGNQPPRRRPTPRNGNNRGRQRTPVQDDPMTNNDLLVSLRNLCEDDIDVLRRVAEAYNIRTDGKSFEDLMEDVTYALEADPDAPAHPDADQAILDWENTPRRNAPPRRRGRQPRDPQPNHNGGLNMRSPWTWIGIGGLVLLLLAALAIIAIMLLDDDDDEPTPDPAPAEESLRDKLIEAVEDGDLDEIDNILETADMSESDIEAINKALESLETAADDADIDEDDLRNDIKDAFEDLDENPSALAILTELNELREGYEEDGDDGDDGTPAPTGTANPSSTQTPTAAPQTRGNTLAPAAAPVYNASAFRHPEQFVDCQKTFDPVADQVDWLTCEPGVLLTNTATFTRAETDDVYRSNCPEGGFWYGSMHHGVVNVKGVGINLPDRGEGTNHLLLIRCALSDGKRDVDLNTTMDIGSFVIGHAIWSPIPPNHPDGSAYVSMEWFGEQLVTSHTTGGTNCGSDGCSKVYVVFYDVNSQSLQTFLVTDIAGETGDSDSDGIVDYAGAKWELVSSNR